MKNFIKRTIDCIRRKPLLVKPVVSGSCFTEDEIKAILTDTKHILKCVDLEEKEMLVRMNIVWKIEHNYR